MYKNFYIVQSNPKSTGSGLMQSRFRNMYPEKLSLSHFTIDQCKNEVRLRGSGCLFISLQRRVCVCPLPFLSTSPPPSRNERLARTWHFEFWLPKNTPLPFPENKNWPELGTLSFDCPRIHPPPPNWGVWRLSTVSPKDIVSLYWGRGVPTSGEMGLLCPPPCSNSGSSI